MGLLSFLKLKRQDPPARKAAPADVVAQARTKARRTDASGTKYEFVGRAQIIWVRSEVPNLKCLHA